jgi:hypothetical protein
MTSILGLLILLTFFDCSLSLSQLSNLFKPKGPSGPSAIELKRSLSDVVSKTQPNGIKAKPDQREEVNRLVEQLEKVNPTKNPANSPIMNGFWRMTYTDYAPAAPSSGQLGPFIGDVYQDLDSNAGIIKNILDIKFPPLRGALIAKQRVKDKVTWEIEFDRVGNKIGGFISLPIQKFIPGDQIRLWEITYLDQTTRIMRARRPESARDDSFVFILEREEKVITIDV